MRHIELEIDQFTGSRKEWRKRSWGTIVAFVILSAVFVYPTYLLNRDGFAWYSVPLGLLAGLMIMGLMSSLFNPEVPASTEELAAAQPGSTGSS